MDMMLGEGSDTTIMILDAMSLRRAGFSSLLAGWAQSNGLTLKSSDLTENDLVDRCKMLVLCIGSHTFDDANLVQKIKAIQAQRPEAISVVISDRDEPDEMVRAFQVGFRGFIPTALEPAIVFQALNFIMNGGWFLPPTILHRFLAPTDIAISGPGQRTEGGPRLGSQAGARSHRASTRGDRASATGNLQQGDRSRTPDDGGDSQSACSADHEKARRLESDAGCLDLRGRAAIPDVGPELGWKRGKPHRAPALSGLFDCAVTIDRSSKAPYRFSSAPRSCSRSASRLVPTLRPSQLVSRACLRGLSTG